MHYSNIDNYGWSLSVSPEGAIPVDRVEGQSLLLFRKFRESLLSPHCEVSVYHLKQDDQITISFYYSSAPYIPGYGMEQSRLHDQLLYFH